MAGLIGLGIVYLLILFAIACAVYRRTVIETAFIGLVVFVFGACLFVGLSRTVLVGSLFLTVALVICRWAGASRGTFAGIGAGVVLLAYAATAVFTIPTYGRVQQLATDYPVVPVGDRLSYERQSDFKSVGHPVPDESFEDSIHKAVRYPRRELSLRTLERMHTSFADTFAELEGFGVVRMARLPAERKYLELAERDSLTLPAMTPISETAQASESFESLDNIEAYDSFHRKQVVDFSNPNGFGLPVDGGTIATHVRGFQPHAFSTIPEDSPADDEWQLARLELVSLLKHDPPAVYLSEHLPRMQELASIDAPTRPLDGFEAKALQRLLDGETIVAEESRNRITMLGGLRAARQCLQCHSVGEGHLLGAFSYEFFRKEPLPPQDEKPKPTKPVT